jgi:DhnA family fructose-bisphosphate aldolase class Ia
VLDPVAPPESEYATNLTVEPVHVWHVAGGDSLVYQVELAPVERRQIKHVRFDALQDGATEVDMVLPIGLLKAQRYREVFADILYVRQAVEQPARLRVALETGLLTTDNCYLGRVPLINSGGASGKNDLAEAVRTAVINKPAGATGFISGRKAFRGG